MFNSEQDFEIEFVEEEDGEYELGGISPSDISQVVLFGSDWTTETIITQINSQNINLNPRFQRRDAWNLEKKSRFIESLILGFPIPQIVLAEQKTRRGQYIVIDGKQRLLTLLQFTGSADEKESEFNNFKLKHLDVRKDLNGRTYREFESDPTLQDDIIAFKNQTIRTTVIRNWPNEPFLYAVFHRLNTNSVQLSPQELRQALFPGEFVNYVDDRASKSKQLMGLLKNNGPDNRMRDVELLIRYLGISFFLTDYSGDLKGFLDDTCRILNQAWENKQDLIIERINQFEFAIDAAIQIFGEVNVARKWNGDKFYSQLNRAVLDALLFYFAKPDIRERALLNKDKVLEAFKSLWKDPLNFEDAVGASTKDVKRLYNRLFIWGNSLSRALGYDFPVPQWDDIRNRISI